MRVLPWPLASVWFFHQPAFSRHAMVPRRVSSVTAVTGQGKTGGHRVVFSYPNIVGSPFDALSDRADMAHQVFVPHDPERLRFGVAELRVPGRQADLAERVGDLAPRRLVAALRLELLPNLGLLLLG
ncbi:MAG: hypothetical protein EOO77_42350, partial [Oxalobacteraceae bacterium]